MCTLAASVGFKASARLQELQVLESDGQALHPRVALVALKAAVKDLKDQELQSAIAVYKATSKSQQITCDDSVPMIETRSRSGI